MAAAQGSQGTQQSQEAAAKSAEELTAAVLDQVNAASPRIQELLTALIRHLHAFAAETRPTAQEWRYGLDFLARTGEFCTPGRHEFILLSDLLGLSALTNALANPGPEQMTPSTVEGPFHNEAPPRELGAIIATGPEWERGEWTVLHGTIRDTGGAPVGGGTIDFWQADDHGHYDVQEPQQAGNLRGLMTVAPDGGYWVRTVKPISYSVPVDGTGGELLKALNRQPMRPAHIHAEVRAPGFRTLTTHLFVAGDEYLGSDAAWGVRDGLAVEFARNHDQAAIERFGMPGPFYDVSYDFVLVRQ